jgi:Protein of unknown function (DUF3263)
MNGTDGTSALFAQQEITGTLSETERTILALERSWFKYPGAKEQTIRDQLGMSAMTYYQILNALMDTEAALAHDPMLIKRLRRMRTTRQRGRMERRLDQCR